jgi:hypothetical protein
MSVTGFEMRGIGRRRIRVDVSAEEKEIVWRRRG